VRDLAALAERLGLAGNDQPAAAAAAVRALEKRGRWLLIFDNVSQPAPVRPFLPQADTGWVVVTSRHAAWGQDAHNQRVGPLSSDSAVGLLESRSGHREAPRTRALAERLGGLPLALEQAGAYLEASGMAVDEYLGLLEARSKELFSRSVDPEARTVATVWETSFEQLYTNHPPAADLLTLAAFLAPDDIPRVLSEGLEPLGDPLAYSDALAELARYSLVTRIGDSFSVHRLVQDVTRERLDDADRVRWAQTTVEAVDASIPFDFHDPSTWAMTGRLLPHALRACEHGLANQAGTRVVLGVLTDIGHYLQRTAEYQRSQEVFELVVRLIETDDDSDDWALGVALASLGNVLRDQALLDDARSVYERALAIIEAEVGPNHREGALIHFGLAQVLSQSGDPGSALPEFERALAILRDAENPDEASIASMMSGLGVARSESGDLDGAQAVFEEALALVRKVFPPDHPELAVSTHNVGLIKYARDDLDGARDAFVEALRIDEGAYGPDHPEVATDLLNLGVVLQHQGDVDAARAALERALDIYERVLGPGHPSTDAARVQLAALSDG
jgi:tetratricopeptide (TPR) repeat protein